MDNITNLSGLVSIVTEQTRLEKAVVEKFIKLLFIETEATLLKNSLVKVINLGTFKIIKSGDGFKMLFLPDFKPYPRALPVGYENIGERLSQGVTVGVDSDVVTENIALENIEEVDENYIVNEVSQNTTNEPSGIIEKDDQERLRRKKNLIKILLFTVGIILLIVIIYMFAIKDKSTAYQSKGQRIDKFIDHMPNLLIDIDMLTKADLFTLYRS